MNPDTLPVGTTNGSSAAGGAADEVVAVLRARSTWLANTKQELMTPVNAIIGLVEMLLADTRERGRQDFVADLEKVHAAAVLFVRLVQDTLDPAAEAAGEADFGKKIRHELRTPLNHVIGYCDLWLEQAEGLLLEGFVNDLQKIHDLGKQLLARLDDIVSFTKLASQPEIPLSNAPLPNMIRDVAACLPARAEENRGSSLARKCLVLVVDDNPINRDILCRWLEREGHRSAVAENGRQALELIRSQPFDLVLLDIIMPEVNGLQVLQQLKADEKLCHLPVIMISAFEEVDIVVHCIEMGAEDYLSKPFNPVLLKARVNACLEKKLLRDREVLYLEQIDQERRRSNELLHVILPAEIAKELKTTNAVRPRRHDNVAVLFCDIVGFTSFCDKNAPEQIVAYLQQLIEPWEQIALRYSVEKIKTIGDAFMAAAGLLQPVDNPVLACVRCGLEMIQVTQALPVGWNIRVGVHAGPVVAGVIGRRQYLFDLWGDTVNTASRMESNGVPGSITLSGAAWKQIAHCSRGTSLGPVPVKGKGRLEMVRFDGFTA